MSDSPRLRNKHAVIDEISRRQVEVRTVPFEVQFSTEHRCNLRCVQCGATIERNRGIVPLMDRRLPVRALERFKKIEHALPAFEWLSLTGSGEPLISPDLPAILEVACGHECAVAFNTNGTLWTRARAEMVVERGVDEIRFSVDAACKETFEKIRVNAKWEKVLDAVRTLAAVKAEKGSDVPKITFSSNFMRQNIEELPDLVDLAADLGAEQLIANNTIIYEPAMQQEALVHHRTLSARMVRAAMVRAEARGIAFVNQLHDLADDAPPDDALPDDAPAPPPVVAPVEPQPRPQESAVAAPAPSAAEPAREPAPAFEVPPSPCRAKDDAPRERPASLDVESILPPLPGLPDDLPDIVHACQRPWTGLYVENDGWVKVCCFDAPPIGNLDQQSFDEIWNGPLAQNLRRSFLEGRPPEGCVNCFIFAKSQARTDVFVQEADTGKSYVDSPGLDPTVSGVFAVHGWALEPDGVERVEVLVDGESLGAVPCDRDRPDVVEAFPGFPDGARCGFRFDLDTADLAAGDHVLRLRVHTRGGRRCEGVERLIRVVR